jgi:8-oxo-dGTP pyrophosphatase MutT (NUDIX family)
MRIELEEMIEERSAGAVVFNIANNNILFLLLNYPTGHWDFPKGNIEKGEEPIDTVKREIHEETSIENIEIIPGFSKKIEYHYRRKAGLVHKQVIYLLAESKTRKVTLSFEHTNYVWKDFEKAINLVTYKNSKIILREASNFLIQDSKNRDGSFQ